MIINLNAFVLDGCPSHLRHCSLRLLNRFKKHQTPAGLPINVRRCNVAVTIKHFEQVLFGHRVGNAIQPDTGCRHAFTEAQLNA